MAPSGAGGRYGKPLRAPGLRLHAPGGALLAGPLQAVLPPRGRRLTHPVLRHAGTLEQSIDGSLYSDNRTVKPAPGRKAAFRRSQTYTITAAPESSPWQGVRGVRRSGPTTYAAVHNAPGGTYWSNQYRKSRAVRRQFMGTNPKLDAEIARHYPYIFNGLPGIPNAPTR